MARWRAAGPSRTLSGVRLVVAAGTLWLLFALGLMLNIAGKRRLMRVADGLLAVELLALVTPYAIDGDGTAALIALVICPSVAVGFLVHCVQVALRDARGTVMSRRARRL
jgi:hypothetical protein